MLRRKFISRLMLFYGSLTATKSVSAQTSDDAPLDFGFIKQPPGEMISIGRHRLHSICMGDAKVTVLFESGLGGSALEWLPIAEDIHESVRVCLYDRSGYAWSDPGEMPRHVLKLANEAQQLLAALEISDNIILVGHSYGGLIMRQLASSIPESIIGLVLVDASHEDQFDRLEGESSISMLPTSKSFVVSAPELPEGLRADIKKKILALSRMRKTYTALHAEIASFRDSCNYMKKNKTTFEFPVQIISRGIDLYANDSGAGDKNKIWHEMQQEYLSLSEKSEQIIAENSGHHIHVDRPEYIKSAIDKIVKMSSE